MTSIRCITPNKLELTLNIEDLPFDATEHQVADWFERVLSVDRWLATHGFTPLPLPTYGGGKGGGNTAKPNWIDVDPDNPVLYINFTWHGKDKEANTAYKNEWLAKIQQATGVKYSIDKTRLDANGKELYLYVYPLRVGKQLLEVLPEGEFERRPALKARLEAAAKK